MSLFFVFYLTPRLKYFHLWRICADVYKEKKLLLIKLLFLLFLTLFIVVLDQEPETSLIHIYVYWRGEAKRSKVQLKKL